MRNKCTFANCVLHEFPTVAAAAATAESPSASVVVAVRILDYAVDTT